MKKKIHSQTSLYGGTSPFQCPGVVVVKSSSLWEKEKKQLENETVSD